MLKQFGLMMRAFLMAVQCPPIFSARLFEALNNSCGSCKWSVLNLVVEILHPLEKQQLQHAKQSKRSSDKITFVPHIQKTTHKATDRKIDVTEIHKSLTIIVAFAKTVNPHLY